MNQLLDTDFLPLVKSARSAVDRREKGDNAPLAIGDAEQVIADIKRTFEIRNIVCHEVYWSPQTTVEEIQRLCDSCYLFARASIYAVDFQLEPNPCIGLKESLDAANRRISVLTTQIQEAENKIRKVLREPEQLEFDKMQAQWRAYVESEADFFGSLLVNGQHGVIRGKQIVESRYREKSEELVRMRDQSPEFQTLERGAWGEITPLK